MTNDMHKQYNIAGSIVIPIYIRCSALSDSDALRLIQESINSRTISSLTGSLQTFQGRDYPLIAKRVRVNWFEAVSEEEIF